MENLELKAICRDLKRARTTAIRLCDELVWRRRQTDTYFNVPFGKLKLREVEQKRAELIGYRRPDLADAKVSDYEIVIIEDAASLKSLLLKTHESDIVVVKMRELYLWKNVRIHLDDVEGLGQFIEFEAVMDEEHEVERSKRNINFLMDQFQIKQENLVTTGYYELLRSKEKHAQKAENIFRKQ